MTASRGNSNVTALAALTQGRRKIAETPVKPRRTPVARLHPIGSRRKSAARIMMKMIEV